MVVFWGLHTKKCSWLVQQRRITAEDHRRLSLNISIENFKTDPVQEDCCVSGGTLCRLLF